MKTDAIAANIKPPDFGAPGVARIPRRSHADPMARMLTSGRAGTLAGRASGPTAFILRILNAARVDRMASLRLAFMIHLELAQSQVEVFARDEVAGDILAVRRRHLRPAR